MTSLTDDPIGDSTKLLVSAVGRAENTGMKYNVLRTRVTSSGDGPILMEPVNATLAIEAAQDDLIVRPILPDGTRENALATKREGGKLVFDIGGGNASLYYEVSEG